MMLFQKDLTTSKRIKNGRRPHFFLNKNDNLKKKEKNIKNGKRPKKMEEDLKKKRNQSTNINLIACDTIVDSHSLFYWCKSHV
jgi:hypothetical protein